MSTASVARVYSEASQMKDYFEEEKEKIEKKKLKQLSKESVEDQIFKAGLSCLGKTFNNGRHAYLNLTISNNNLVSIVVSTITARFTIVQIGNRKVQIPAKHRCFKQQIDSFEGSLTLETFDQTESILEPTEKNL